MFAALLDTVLPTFRTSSLIRSPARALRSRPNIQFIVNLPAKN
jgi:hypothetical protein